MSVILYILGFFASVLLLYIVVVVYADDIGEIIKKLGIKEKITKDGWRISDGDIQCINSDIIGSAGATLIISSPIIPFIVGFVYRDNFWLIFLVGTPLLYIASYVSILNVGDNTIQAYINKKNEEHSGKIKKLKTEYNKKQKKEKEKRLKEKKKEKMKEKLERENRKKQEKIEKEKAERIQKEKEENQRLMAQMEEAKKKDEESARELKKYEEKLRIQRENEIEKEKKLTEEKNKQLQIDKEKGSYVEKMIKASKESNIDMFKQIVQVASAGLSKEVEQDKKKSAEEKSTDLHKDTEKPKDKKDG